MRNECKILDPKGHTRGLTQIFEQLEGLYGQHGELEEVDVLKGRMQIRWLHVGNSSWCIAAIEPGTKLKKGHTHLGQTEDLYGIIGYAELEIAGRKRILGPGDNARIGADVKHTVTRYWSDDDDGIIIHVGRLRPRTGIGINGYDE